MADTNNNQDTNKPPQNSTDDLNASPTPKAPPVGTGSDASSESTAPSPKPQTPSPTPPPTPDQSVDSPPMTDPLGSEPKPPEPSGSKPPSTGEPKKSDHPSEPKPQPDTPPKADPLEVQPLTPDKPLSDPLAGAYEHDEETTNPKPPAPEGQPATPSPKPSTSNQSPIPDKPQPVPEVKEVPPVTPASEGAKIKIPPAQSKVAPQPVGKRATIKRSGNRALKIIGWVVGILIILIAVFYLFFYRATLIINPTPTPDEITLDGEKVEPGTYRVNPGRHKVKVKKDGYISYVIDREFKIAQKTNLDFTFQKQAKGDTIATKGSNVVLSSDKNFVIFIGNDNKLYSYKIGTKSAPQAVTTNSYQNARQLLVAENNKFALILDKDGIKIADFLRSDLINQTQTKLPPLASAIHSVTWNTATDSYFTEANAYIIYDIKTDYGWDLIFANRSHNQSEILMQIDEERFNNVQLDWSTNSKQVSIAGGELGIIDLTSRAYTEVLKDKKIISAQWSPQGTKLVARSRNGEIYTKQGDTAIKLGFEGDLFAWVSETELVVIDDGRPQLYNFDTEEIINYAEIDGLSNCQSFAVIDGVIYFANKEGIKSASLQLPAYQ